MQIFLKERLLRSPENQDNASKTADLMMTKLTLAIGMIYDSTVNIDVTVGLTNGSSCTVCLVKNRLPSVSRPSIVWVKSLDAAVGKIARQKYKHLFHQGINDDWTPIFHCQRSLLFLIQLHSNGHSFHSDQPLVRLFITHKDALLTKLL